MKKTQVFIVDDHPFFRSGLGNWLNQQDTVLCCGEASSVAAARTALAHSQPDIVLMDMRLADGDGIKFTRELSDAYPRLRVIMLSQSDEDAYAHRALNAGARGYIMKSEATDAVLDAIRTVERGDIYLSSSATSKMVHNLFPDRVGEGLELARLTDREMQVFRLVGAGKNSRDIAELLKISPKTVDTYRENIKNKLNLSDSASVLRVAIRWVEQGDL